MSSVPSWYDGEKCGTMYSPDCHRAMQSGFEFAKQNGIKPWTKQSSDPNIIVAAIDCQVDFIAPPNFDDQGKPTFADTGKVNPNGGNLAVPGAVQDIDRLNRFLFNNVAMISQVVASLDTHYAFQCFHPFTWKAGSHPANRNSNGQAYSPGDFPEPFTIITLDDMNRDSWVPTRFPTKMREMLQKLEKDSKKQLCIWPMHCELGTPGHAFEPAFMEAVHFHSGTRNSQYDATTKGMAQWSEHYGILQAEVQFAEDRQTSLNTRVLTKWEMADRIYFAGFAKSHCVLETLNQVVKLFSAQSKQALLEKLFVLRDCMSSVPDICDETGNVIVPFNKIADDRFAELEQMGVKFVDSTDPIDLN